MRIVLIAAVARNGVIGRDGQLPWHLPADLRHFRLRTTGRPIIMGRRTFESIGKPLPKRTNIVMTRSTAFSPPGVHVAHDLDQAIELAAVAAGHDGGEIFVVGGGEIYRIALPRADVLDLTEVDMDIEGDARFPQWSADHFALAHEELHPADDRHACAMRFRRYERTETEHC